MKLNLMMFDDLDEYIVKFEKLVICICVLSMITTASCQVLLRNTLSIGFLWGEHLIKVLILWVTFLGASMASHQGKHICMDLVTRYVSKNKKRILETVSSLIVIVCCTILCETSVAYIGVKKINQASQLWPGTPDWIYLCVIPYFFAVTAFRSALFIKQLYLNND